ncbi:hypothetical protein ACJ73_02531 [Blastomyces percursus]|uniref:Uncharacterized protein n=1 Tax=Blastomyces percursus TaxID=1658174 RepID=A0A1J9REL6_9EURO|nr:hypothetical protein ACJ73_02531 [Blastomyces percursus]
MVWYWWYGTGRPLRRETRQTERTSGAKPLRAVGGNDSPAIWQDRSKSLVGKCGMVRYGMVWSAKGNTSAPSQGQTQSKVPLRTGRYWSKTRSKPCNEPWFTSQRRIRCLTIPLMAFGWVVINTRAGWSVSKKELALAEGEQCTLPPVAFAALRLCRTYRAYREEITAGLKLQPQVTTGRMVSVCRVHINQLADLALATGGQSPATLSVNAQVQLQFSTDKLRDRRSVGNLNLTEKEKGKRAL